MPTIKIRSSRTRSPCCSMPAMSIEHDFHFFSCSSKKHSRLFSSMASLHTDWIGSTESTLWSIPQRCFPCKGSSQFLCGRRGNWIYISSFFKQCYHHHTGGKKWMLPPVTGFSFYHCRLWESWCFSKTSFRSISPKGKPAFRSPRKLRSELAPRSAEVWASTFLCIELWGRMVGGGKFNLV